MPCRKRFVVPPLQISAKKGTGVDDLLETVALVAEVEQLMSNPDRAAAGTVLEAHLDRRIGAISTLLVQTGTLRVGDVIVAGSAYGKVCADSCSYHPGAIPSSTTPAAHLFVGCMWCQECLLLNMVRRGQSAFELFGQDSADLP